MKIAFIIHGSYGNPDENWFPWLKKELEKLNYKVFVPEFPTPKAQHLENWLEIFKEHEKILDENSIVIGHSLGPSFLLTILERVKKQIKAAFFVSGFAGLLDNPEFDKINKTFVDKKFDWEKIKTNCKKFYIIHSNNDPYVPLKEAEKLANNLDEEIIIIKNAGHFNEKADYKKFEELLNLIKDLK